MSSLQNILANTNRSSDAFTQLELVSVRALIGYVARNRNVNELFVRKMLVDNFKVSGIEELPQNQYDAVVRYLIDLPVNHK